MHNRYKYPKYLACLMSYSFDWTTVANADKINCNGDGKEWIFESSQCTFNNKQLFLYWKKFSPAEEPKSKS